MKLKKFNYKLYIDGIRQLKLIGIMSTIILSVFAIIVPVGHFIDSMHADEYGRAYFADIALTLEQAVPINHVIYLIIVPVMCLSLFNFLTKRNACDFYHAAPVRREGICFSFYAAIMTWVIGMLTLSGLIGIITMAVLPGMSVIIPSIFVYFFEILAASVLVAGGFMIAVSLTGTTFTNLVVAIIILFFPRIFIAASTLMLNSSLPYINLSSRGLLLNHNNNLLIRLFSTVLFSFSSNKAAQTSVVVPIIYSFVVGLFYAAVGCFLFARRRSEAAGNAAISRRLQLVFRLIIGFSFCLLPCYIIYSMIVDGDNDFDISMLFSLFVLYVVALIIYFLYELITTKKLKNLVKAIPGAGILLLLNAAFILLLLLGTFIIKNTLPKAENVKSFNIISSDNTYNADYFSRKSSKIKITDKQAINDIVSYLNATAEKCDEDPYSINNSFARMDVKINTDLLDRTYTIAVSSSEYKKIISSLKSNDEYMRLYTELPVADVNHTTVSSYDNIPQKGVNKIYETARMEIHDIGFEEAYDILNNSADSIGMLNVSTTSGIEQYSFYVPVSLRLPKTYAAYLSEYNKAFDSEKLTDIISDWKTNSIAAKNNLREGDYFSENISILCEDEDIYCYLGWSYEYELNPIEGQNMPSDEQLKLLSELSKHIKLYDEAMAAANEPIIDVIYNYSADTPSGYDSGNLKAYYTADKEGFEILNRLSRIAY